MTTVGGSARAVNYQVVHVSGTTALAYGIQQVGSRGLAVGMFISGGWQQVSAGGVVSNTALLGGDEYLNSGGLDEGELHAIWQPESNACGTIGRVDCRQSV